MAWEINRELTIKEKPLQKSFDLIILQAVENLLPGKQIDWVESKLVRRDMKKMTRTYLVMRACNYRDKN